MFAVAFIIIATGCGKKVEVSFATSEINVAPEGGATEVVLTSNGEWTSNSTPDWLMVSPASGNGSATIVVTAEPNNGTEERSGEITVSSKDNSATLIVRQSARSAFIELNPASIECDYDGGNFEVSVASNVDWEVTSTSDWVLIEPVAGSQEAVLSVTIAPLLDDASPDRETLVKVGNAEMSATLHVVQHAAPVYTIELNPRVVEISSEGGTEALALTCNGAWTAIVEQEWIVLNELSGEGDASLSLTVAPNDKMMPRDARARFTSQGGQTATLIVHQEALPDPHFLTVSPMEMTLPSEGGSFDLAIECDTIWELGSSGSWIEFTPTHGEGNGTVLVEVGANTQAYGRDGHINVYSFIGLHQTVMVYQDGSGAQIVLEMAPDTVFVSPEGGVGTIDLTSNVPWTLETLEWVNLLQVSGNGDAAVGLVVDKNPKAKDRYAIVNAFFEGQALAQTVVFQPARYTYLEAGVNEVNVPNEGGSFTIDVTSNQAWRVRGGENWLSYTPQIGVGDGQFVITVQPLPDTRPRACRILLCGQEDDSEVLIVVSQGQ